MSVNRFDEMLAGGHPNSLGNTVVVVDEVLRDRALLDQLIACYRSDDPVVRLRVSNAMKRVAREQPDWVADHLNDLLSWIAEIDQASTKWTLSTLFMWLNSYMTTDHRDRAIEIMKQNLHFDDWIVQNTTAESLAHFARHRADLTEWLVPELHTLANSPHKSVARRALKLKASLEAQ